MREHASRGKRKDNGEWVYGVPVVMKHNDKRDHEHYFIIPNNTDMSYGVLLEDCLVEVIPETVGEYTGLKDKNGVKIFEGDIVRDEYANLGRIMYLQQECGYVVVLPQTDYRLGHRSRGGNYNTDCNLEVIGTIHDNPELLNSN